jgi:hypothetical protein
LPASHTQILRPVRTRVPEPLHFLHGRQYRFDGDRFRPPPPHRTHGPYGQNQHANAYPPAAANTARAITTPLIPAIFL